MRAWALGLPWPPAPPLLGRPLRHWLQLFLLTHRVGADGWQRIEWPDGGPLLAQPWPQVVLLGAVADELERIAQQPRRTATQRPAGH